MMPIDTRHPLFRENVDKWTRCRDSYEGDDAIKAKGQMYLPKIDPNQSRQEYDSFRDRALYFEAVGRSIDGFTGAISRKPHVIKLPPVMEPFRDDATLDGISLSEFVKRLCAETLLIGRAGILLDYDETARRPYLSLYAAESIINWWDDCVVLHETVYEQDPLDRFQRCAVEQIRELSLLDGVYTVTLWRKVANLKAGNQWQIYGEPIVPTRRGQPLSALPWFWLSFSGHTAQISKPPLLGMVNVALSHYRLGADYAHGLHWTGLPTFYVTGSSSDEAVKVGSATALVLADSAARVGFAEFKGDGLGSLERAMAAKERMLAILGAAVFGTDAKRIETAEAARIRNSGETSLLMGVVSAVQASLEAAMKFAADWQGAAGDVSVSLNTDFVSEKMDPQTLVGLVAAYQAGALTLSSLLAALQDGELLPPQTDIADEVAKLGGQADGGEGAQVGHPAGGKQPSDRGHRQTAKEFGITRRTVERAEKIAAE